MDVKLVGNTIVITGGGSGIGESLAHRLHDLGNTVIVAGRRLEALRAAVGTRPNMHALLLDVDKAAGVAAFAEALIGTYPKTNVLINNAGIMRLEDIGTKRDLRDAEATIETNLLGPIRLTDALLGHLSRQADAAIVNVTSALAFVPFHAAATYSATKAAMHSYTLSLRERLRDEVEVIELAPPGVQTAIDPRAEARSGYMPVAAFVDEVIEQLGRTPTPPEIIVSRAAFLRRAEAEGRLESTMAQVNAPAAS